tara:strand:+ start:9299 stop:10069 length:771 start_codon:yes stop_codon:yes gene_type:complete
MSHSQTVQSLHRGLDLLESIADASQGLTSKELAQRTRLKSTTFFNLARTLVERGYLQKSNTRPVIYSMGPALEELCGGNVSTSRAALDESLLRLSRQFPAWRFVTAEAHGVDIRIAHAIEPARPETVLHDTRKWMPPYTSASSLCHLAFWPSERAKSFQAAYPFPMYGVGLWGREEKLDQAIADFRAKGAVEIYELSPARMAVPLYNRNNQLVASLGASSTSGLEHAREDLVAILELLKTEAKFLCPHLGRVPSET